MVAAPSGVPHPYPDHPLKGNHAAWHAALNAHPFLLFFTSCSISTFLFPFYHYFITKSLRDVPPRQTHRQNDSPQTDGLDRLLQVPPDPVVLVPLLGQHVVPLSVIRYPLSIYPEGGADVAVVVLPVPLITVVNGRVLHGVPHGRFGWLSGPGGSEVWSTLSTSSHWSDDVLRWVPFLFRIKPSVMPKCNVVHRPSWAPKGNVERSPHPSL